MCRLANMRYAAIVYAESSVDKTGEPDKEMLVGNLVNSVFDWVSPEEPYRCDCCGEVFYDWDDALGHLDAEASK